MDWLLWGLVGAGLMLAFIYLAEKLTRRFANFLLYGNSRSPDNTTTSGSIAVSPEQGQGKNSR